MVGDPDPVTGLPEGAAFQRSPLKRWLWDSHLPGVAREVLSPCAGGQTPLSLTGEEGTTRGVEELDHIDPGELEHRLFNLTAQDHVEQGPIPCDDPTEANGDRRLHDTDLDDRATVGSDAGGSLFRYRAGEQCVDGGQDAPLGQDWPPTQEAGSAAEYRFVVVNELDRIAVEKGEDVIGRQDDLVRARAEGVNLGNRFVGRLVVRFWDQPAREEGATRRVEELDRGDSPELKHGLFDLAAQDPI